MGLKYNYIFEKVNLEPDKECSTDIWIDIGGEDGERIFNCNNGQYQSTIEAVYKNKTKDSNNVGLFLDPVFFLSCEINGNI